MSEKEPAVVLAQVAGQLGLEIGFEQQERLLAYCNLLLEELQRHRVTGEETVEDLIVRQIYDSLYPLMKMSFMKGSKIVDLGSGGGLPGIPLAICSPHCDFYLMDSNRKKITFLDAVANKLKLKNVYTLHGRAEQFGRSLKEREGYDYIVSKAVAVTAILAELALPLLAIGGKALFYKGPRGDEELSQATRAIEVCGGRLTERWSYNLLTGEERIIFLIRKVTPTNSNYPRSAGKPAKRPLLSR